KRFGVEFKFSLKPLLTKSMLFAKEQLNLHHVFCLYPGDRRFPLSDNITAYGLNHLQTLSL
ncbi:MAG: hypothetical protein OXB88_04235, partial [Bacteriovoracales bacterium]|nr:hypothetical protein [Bacteriovoracales bacterium]